MGNPVAFKSVPRIEPRKEKAVERKEHYQEFVKPLDVEVLNSQAARCMDCGVPFCHSGCPLGNNIPAFNDAVYKNDFEAAYNILAATNNFPEFTGRICPAPCESACVLGINKDAVSIEEIEKHIIEYAFANGLVGNKQKGLPTGKKVAIIGSGPAGLAAADQLNLAGHEVSVFERNAKPGGLLRFGIPDFKLGKDVVERRIKLMESEGVHFYNHIEVGVQISAQELYEQYDAIVVATGSTVPRDLAIPGRNLKGVHFAMELLEQQNKVNAHLPFDGERIDLHDATVVVIGGGDTGSDCIGTSNRQGAKAIIQLELLPMPPIKRNVNMPWPNFPMLLKVTSSHEEGCERKWSVLTKAFIGDENGKLKAIQVCEIEWNADENGRFSEFKEVPNSLREIPCNFVFLAMGFLHTQQEGLLKELKLGTDSKGNLAAQHYITNVEKVFAAGDARRGQSLVVWAIAEGRSVAQKVDEWLMGYSLLP